jgi:hypothetical protein
MTVIHHRCHTGMRKQEIAAFRLFQCLLSDVLVFNFISQRRKDACVVVTVTLLTDIFTAFVLGGTTRN